jgi:hypothetical protein
VDAAVQTKLWFTTKEAAAFIGIAPTSMRSLVARGKIRPDHRGGSGGEGLKTHRFHIDTLNSFLGKR